MQEVVILECTEARKEGKPVSRYLTRRNKKTVTERIEKKKYNPFLKRHTYLPQVYLGISFGWSIPMAFAAVTGSVPALAWVAFLANVLWSTGYDTWYAMVDREDDIRMGARSTAILFGDADLIALARAYLYQPRWSWQAAAALGGTVSATAQYWRCLPAEAKTVFGSVSVGAR
jgi:4-hydroxybenzoate polyprenyltransferase